MKRLDLRAQQRIAWWLLILLMVAYLLEMSHQAILRYDTFKATAFDLGNMDQVLWNTIHSRLFQFTNQAIDWYGPSTRLAIHFEPIILPLSLLYLFHADPRILLVFQTLALAAGALPVFLLTRKYLPEWPLLAVAMAGAYLLAPALLGLNIFDFHPVSLAAPLLLYALLALAYKRYVWFIIACILAASCKEDVPLAIAVLGFLLLWKYKLPRLGITLMIGGVVWSAIAFGIIIPHFYPGVQHNNYWYRYEELGSSPEVAIINILLHPWLLFTTFLTLDRFYYLASLLRSTGFLALLAPEWLLPALPALAINLLSTDPLSYSGVYHYNAVIIPFIMFSAIVGLRRFFLLWQRWRGEENETEEEVYTAQAVHSARKFLPNTAINPDQVVAFGLLGTVISERRSSLSSTLSHVQEMYKQTIPHIKPLLDWVTLPEWRRKRWQIFCARMIPLAKNISLAQLQLIMIIWIICMIGLNFVIITPQLDPFWADHAPGSHEEHVQELLARIPPGASVSAGSNLNPHLSERQFLLVFPLVSLPDQSDSDHITTVQYIIVDLNNIFTENRAETTSTLNNLINTKEYRVIGRAEGVVLLIRTGPA